MARNATRQVFVSVLCLSLHLTPGTCADVVCDTVDSPRSGDRAQDGSPRINGATVFGARPNSPVLFKIAASGEKPLTYTVDNMPVGLQVDAKTGLLTGTLLDAGDYPLDVTVSNRLGKAQRKLTIRIGDEICLTPPMGWNSWYCHSELVSEQAIRDTAKAMVDKGLVEHGWTYINIDDCWQGERGGPLNAIQPNERFTDIKQLSDDLHAMGLKLGIYSTPWIGTYAGFVGGSAPNENGDYSEFYLSEEKRLQRTQFFGRYPGSIEKGLDRVGHWMFDRDVRQWSEWGIDYVKVDWKPNDVTTTRRIANDLRAGSRDIVLSLSNEAPFENAAELSTLANGWRTTGDIHDAWGSISGIARRQRRWQSFTSPGHWNDMDMLQVGNLATPNRQNKSFKPTRLSADEQRFQMSLWCLLQSPLLLSCDIASMDEFTVELLTNDELLAVHQDPLGKPATFTEMENGFLWVKQLAGGDFAIGLFNDSSDEATMSVNLKEMGLPELTHLRDLWQHRTAKAAHETVEFVVPSHGVVLLRTAQRLPDVEGMAESTQNHR